MPTYIEPVSSERFTELCKELKNYSAVPAEYFDRF